MGTCGSETVFNFNVYKVGVDKIETSKGASAAKLLERQRSVGSTINISSGIF